MHFLVYKYYMHSSYQTTTFGKKCTYHIQIFMVYVHVFVVSLLNLCWLLSAVHCRYGHVVLAHSTIRLLWTNVKCAKLRDRQTEPLSVESFEMRWMPWNDNITLSCIVCTRRRYINPAFCTADIETNCVVCLPVVPLIFKLFIYGWLAAVW